MIPLKNSCDADVAAVVVVVVSKYETVTCANVERYE